MTKMKQFEINKITPNYAYLLGVLLGDGNIMYNRIRIAVKDKDFILNVREKLQKIVREKIKIVKKDNTNGFLKNKKTSFLFHIEFNSVNFVKLIRRDIKKIEFLENKKCQIAFLEGLYDSEGSVDFDRLRIRLIMKNKEVIRLISIHLNNLKIKHFVSQFKNKRGKPKDYPKWSIIRIYDDKVLKFNKLIHFSIWRKEKILINLIKKKRDKEEYEIKKRKETLIMKRKEWCKKYNLTRNQYQRHKRVEKSKKNYFLLKRLFLTFSKWFF